MKNRIIKDNRYIKVYERTAMRPEIKIKLEVDTHLTQGFATEEKLLLKPFPFYAKSFSLPDLFAGKMHALLFREWKRVKGRDWFDLKRYIRRGTLLHLEHLRLRATGSGDGKEKTMTKANLLQLLDKKIDNVSIANIKADIVRFIPDSKLMDIWSPAYFPFIYCIQKSTANLYCLYIQSLNPLRSHNQFAIKDCIKVFRPWKLI